MVLNTISYLVTRYCKGFFYVEAEYAQKKQKIIISCNMERGYDPSGWLGIIIGGQFYFDFSGTFPFENKMQELLREVKLHLKKVTVDNLETKVETSRRMEDDPTENNKGAGTCTKHDLPCMMYSQIYIIKWYNSFSFSIEKDRVGEKNIICVSDLQTN